jgi:hypothetical protein
MAAAFSTSSSAVDGATAASVDRRKDAEKQLANVTRIFYN